MAKKPRTRGRTMKEYTITAKVELIVNAPNRKTALEYAKKESYDDLVFIKEVKKWILKNY